MLDFMSETGHAMEENVDGGWFLFIGNWLNSDKCSLYDDIGW